MILTSMTDYVLEQKEILANQEIDLGTFALRIFKYANFLKQTLTLGMFVPCDNNGNPYNEDGTDGEGYVIDRIMFKEYQQAKERVLFDGFCLFEDNEGLYIESKQGTTLFPESFNGINIEWLMGEDLTLTESAIKTYGL